MGWAPAVELHDGEEIVLSAAIPFGAVVVPAILTLGLGFAIIRLKRWVVTTERVVMLGGFPGGRTVVSVPLARVQDASVTQRAWQGRVLITTAGAGPGTVEVGPLLVADARAFAAAVLERAGTGAGV